MELNSCIYMLGCFIVQAMLDKGIITKISDTI